MLTAQTVYESTVIALSKSEQLKLAALILDDLSESASTALDYSDSWSEEDIQDLTVYAAQHAEESNPEDGDRA